jgi:hypothetical protein
MARSRMRTVFPRIGLPVFWAALVFLAGVLILLPAPGVAQTEHVLSVETGTSGEAQSYSLEDLRGLPVHVIRTSTPWTDGVQEFVGVALAALVGDAAAGGMLTLTALNDYSVTIPVAEVMRDVPIVAYQRNGSPMSLREKGPLWLIYPFDLGGEYQTETVYSRSIWQLMRIRVEE